MSEVKDFKASLDQDTESNHHWVRLKDGTAVLIRPPGRQDIEQATAFFQALPPEDRRFLRGDVTRPQFVEQRLRQMDSGKVKRLVALVQDQIVADGALELAGYEWTSHMGEIRLIVAREFRRKGLGMLMARELYALAAREKVEILVARMMRPQHAARRIFRTLGFHGEEALSSFVRDRSGESQDLIIMRCNLEEMWRELELFFEHSDWQRAR